MPLVNNEGKAMNITGNAIVFGGGGGIGRATALAFAEAGAAGVLIADIDLEAAKSAASEIVAASKQPGFRAELRVETVFVDITAQQSVESAFEKMVDTFGRIDYCVNCAGVSSSALLPLVAFSGPNNMYPADPRKDTTTNR
ncbi:hypothetical protein SLS62_010941 [Diatrype stigma]|uniref:Uncharacterized protein n=1 Tax=Diatrype stigma TaxID=117547 RepID=A0AAN9U6X3_9PEZI